MRSSLLAMAVALAFISGEARADAAKAPPPDVGAGRIAWFDLTTTDLPRSRAFYAQLLDWQFNPVQGTDLALEIVAGGAAIGTLRVAEGAISPFNGVVYVQVADIQAACRKSAALGGTVAPGFPFDLPDETGAIALILDPTGHPLGIYSRTSIAEAAQPAK